MTQPLRVGTRASALALTQTTTVAERVSDLSGAHHELVRIRTEGDVHKGSLTQIGGTGVFVAALRDALLDDRCDLAVHSLKDLPTTPADGLTVAAIPERSDTRDALCARDGLTLATLPDGATVGTGSPRRAAQLRAARPGLDVIDIRGNVDTRLGRVAGLSDSGPGDLDAVVLAAAGLLRLGRDSHITELIDPTVMLPAPGQGALAVECRTSDAEDSSFAAALRDYDHTSTRLAVTAERAVLRRLEAGCSAPIGALATINEGVLALQAVVCSLDGTKLLRLARSGRDLSVDGADALGVGLAEDLLAAGAATIAPLTAQ
ncbi:hydroxymethylbilane synthase [Arthrobacter sp. 147(2020)]|uniref:hydroxymethylbilane synthase n=1 Tax=unclassified Arthrobacter TaxID=235627 RepID=UPI001492CE35|nr:hydroxymethylbilane synthase [Arthrobacter sp. 260]NOJ62568.1 hydroxymethylbilane synthase [Arthrobacter sp. 147(2020)]